MISLINAGIVVGIFGTIVMDVLNLIFARAGLIMKIDINMIGRMAAGWLHFRFGYNHPSEMKKVNRELVYGYVAHYSIGIGLAVPFMLIWNLLTGEMASPLAAFVYGVFTTIGSWFLIYPSMGFGMFGRRSPDGLNASVTSLANHIFFGLGLALGVVFV